MIYEIRREYKKSADTIRRITDALKNEWGLSEEEIWYQRMLDEIERLEKLR